MDFNSGWIGKKIERLEWAGISLLSKSGLSSLRFWLLGEPKPPKVICVKLSGCQSALHC